MVGKRVSAKEKLKKDDLFKSTLEVNKTNCKQVNNKLISKEMKRQTYYLEEDTIKAIGLKSVLESRDKSEIVREALKKYIEKNYFELINK